MAKQVIGPRMPRSWLEHPDDGSLYVIDTAEIERWVPQDLLKTCTSVEPVSDLDYRQIGMTAVVMGDVNAVYNFLCGHRRQLLAAARGLNERSLLLRGPPFPRTKTIGDGFIDDLVILSVLHFSDAHRGSLPIEVRRRRCFARLPADGDECGQVR